MLKFLLLTVCGTWLTTAQDMACPSVCPMIYDPVCGSDAQTYASECEMQSVACSKKTAISVASRGECAPVPPVPGSDNAPPEAPAPGCPMMCPMNFSPVCGSNGQTYSNECELEVAACQSKTKVVVAHQGECTTEEAVPLDTGCPQMCPMNYDPVCGTDGKTYSNDCELTKTACGVSAKVEVASTGACDESCNRRCPRLYSPVCAKDGNTYNTECEMLVRACLLKTTLRVLHEGTCDDDNMRM